MRSQMGLVVPPAETGEALAIAMEAADQAGEERVVRLGFDQARR
jgi:hypothetical protein